MGKLGKWNLENREGSGRILRESSSSGKSRKGGKFAKKGKFKKIQKHRGGTEMTT